ncbi:glutathione S-transferase 4-like [Gigantopelta aegis]|uniref:glutathione S-transferase 4-like n=1 Tax=Gigantopelta aegis TaxID=1735272 RepID=UPI001B88CE27|nr:glutathione S-transferase 4-like [Gigantopelta aegis]
MASYKLYYFPSKGLAEPIRLLFAYKGIQYEDIRFLEINGLKPKPNMPFGLCQFLRKMVKKLGGSVVILRYLAEKPEFNVAELFKTVFEKDEEKKKELEKKFAEEVIPNTLAN